MTKKEIQLVIRLLKLEESHTRYAYEVAERSATPTEIDDQLEAQYELGHKAGYATGLLNAVNLLEEILNEAH